jgi:hypothetical protein
VVPAEIALKLTESMLHPELSKCEPQALRGVAGDKSNIITYAFWCRSARLIWWQSSV